MSEREQRYADFDWQERWNDNKGPCALISRSGDDFCAIGPMGVIFIKPKDVPSFAQQMRVFVALLEKEAGA